MCGWQYVGWDHISQGAPYHYATAQVEQRCLQLYMQMEQVDQRRAQDVQEVEEVEGRHWWTVETCTRCARCTRGTRGRIEALPGGLQRQVQDTLGVLGIRRY